MAPFTRHPERARRHQWHAGTPSRSKDSRCASISTLPPAAARRRAGRAAGVFDGGNIMKPWGDVPAPFELTKQIACPVVGFFGLDDTNPSPGDVDRIDAELSRLGKTHEFHRYEGAGHAFLNFSNAERYRPEPAKDAWAKMLGFLERQLKGAA